MYQEFQALLCRRVRNNKKRWRWSVYDTVIKIERMFPFWSSAVPSLNCSTCEVHEERNC